MAERSRAATATGRSFVAKGIVRRHSGLAIAFVAERSRAAIATGRSFVANAITRGETAGGRKRSYGLWQPDPRESAAFRASGSW